MIRRLNRRERDQFVLVDSLLPMNILHRCRSLLVSDFDRMRLIPLSAFAHIYYSRTFAGERLNTAARGV